MNSMIELGKGNTIIGICRSGKRVLLEKSRILFFEKYFNVKGITHIFPQIDSDYGEIIITIKIGNTIKYAFFEYPYDVDLTKVNHIDDIIQFITDHQHLLSNVPELLDLKTASIKTKTQRAKRYGTGSY